MAPSYWEQSVKDPPYRARAAPFAEATGMNPVRVLPPEREPVWLLASHHLDADGDEHADEHHPKGD